MPNRRVSRSSSSARRGRTAGGEGRPHRPLAAAGQHHPVPATPLGQLGQVVDRAALLVTPQVRVGHGRGEPVVALDPAGQDQEVAALRVGHAVLRPAEPQRELGAVDRAQPGGRVGRRGLGQHRCAVEAVVVGEGQAVQPQPDRLLRPAGPATTRRRGSCSGCGSAARRTACGRPRDRRATSRGSSRPCLRRETGASSAPGSPESRRSSSFHDIGRVVPAHQPAPISRSPPRPASRPGRRPAATPGRRRPPPGTARRGPRPSDHHDSSTGQGPAQAATGCQPPPSTPTSMTRVGSPLTTPRSVTATARPDGVADLRGQRARRTPATAPARAAAPARAGRAAAARSARSPHGTAACRSAGLRPPCSTGRVTASNPTIACTRATPRSTSSSPAAAPQPLGCGPPPAPRPRAGTAPARPAPAPPRRPAASAASHRPGAASAPGRRGRARRSSWGCSQVRAEATAPSCSASIRTPVATSCREARSATSRSAVVRTLKQIASTESSGGSKQTSAVRSGGGVRGATSVGASPAGPAPHPGRRSGRSGAARRRPAGPRSRRGCAARAGAAG